MVLNRRAFTFGSLASGIAAATGIKMPKTSKQEKPSCPSNQEEYLIGAIVIDPHTAVPIAKATVKYIVCRAKPESVVQLGTVTTDENGFVNFYVNRRNCAFEGTYAVTLSCDVKGIDQTYAFCFESFKNPSGEIVLVG